MPTLPEEHAEWSTANLTHPQVHLGATVHEVLRHRQGL